ncbi:hypothetical protein ASC80_01620 [Afipia sp. Root123D2]|uniref:hypothetical protein n=1 Tax=Afipia sp. Root123D2 TaxID=1736436 RepID=UPI0006FF4797|nr:hypothetical protein [Afipia sp. Root123D2]KQW22121.1 hypothetical protein ASC80_01620 [Afipia sp. Root123D2]
MTSCTIPRQPKLADTPHTMVGDMQREKIVTLDLEGCNVAYINMLMNEFERDKPVGHRFEQWPEAIRVRMEKEIADWYGRNPTASVKGITQGICDDMCVMAIHWRPKS